MSDVETGLEEDDDAEHSGGIAIAPSMTPAVIGVGVGRTKDVGVVDKRVAWISLLAIGVALASGLVAQILISAIALVTNAAFFQRFSFTTVSPAANHLGPIVVVVPVIGGVIVGLMARFGSKAIRGHGIPEAMEQVLHNESRIPARLTFLKPLSAAIAIGTGGPFGAEGPIIATGGALGSLVGQLLRTTADERKTLLAAGAAAGMAATFGSPVSAVLLAIELLLFEYRARSIIPVALAATAATAVRIALVGAAPVFPLPNVIPPGGEALVAYVVIGAAMGVASIGITRAVYWVEDGFEKLPVHWMWWPAIGGIAVGAIGYFAPRTMGVGYDNIEDIVRGQILGRALFILCVAKFVSWAASLGSGTSGGTLAPIFTIGGALGALCGMLLAKIFPEAGIDPRLGALVGMAATFAGASRALLASVVFAFETTRQPIGLLPLLGGATTAYFISCQWMKNSIMTEKIARRGTRVSSELEADVFQRANVVTYATRDLVTLPATRTVGETREWLAKRSEDTRHQGYPVVNGEDTIGVVTRRDVLDPAVDATRLISSLISRDLVTVQGSDSLLMAIDRMVRARVGRVLVMDPASPKKAVGILTRSDILRAHEVRVRDAALASGRLPSFPKLREMLRSKP